MTVRDQRGTRQNRRTAVRASKQAGRKTGLRRLKRAPEAVPALERALALSRAAEDAPTQSVDLANLGQALIEAGDPVAAAARLQEALTLGPTDAPHLAVAAATLARLGG